MHLTQRVNTSAKQLSGIPVLQYQKHMEQALSEPCVPFRVTEEDLAVRDE